MIKNITKILIAIFIFAFINLGANAESLFTLGASQTYRPLPKSLYGGVQARGVGDLISIILDETVTTTNVTTYNSSKSSNSNGTFIDFWNSFFFNKNILNEKLKGFGGSNEVENSANMTNKVTFGDTVAVQVVQQMPNGNLVVQGKKTLVNGNERADLLVTGVVDPRWITASGQIYSRHVANLQFAMSGRGSISRSSNEGIVNKFLKMLF